MKLRLLGLSVIAASLFPAQTALAQDGEEPFLDQLFETASKTASETLISPTSEGAFGPAPTQLRIESENAGETVKLTISNTESYWKNFQEVQYAITLSAPLDKEAGRGEFLTQVGLPNAYTVGFSTSLSLLAPDRKTLADDVSKDRNETGEALQAAANDLRNRCKAENEKLPEKKRLKCDSVAIWELLQKFPSSIQAQNLARLQKVAKEKMASKSLIALQTSAEIGKKPLSFRNPNDISDKTDVNRTVFNLAASVLYAPRLDGKLALISGVELERNYKLPDKEIRCPAGATVDPTIQCFNAAFGPPKRETSKTLFGAIRYNIGSKILPISGEFRIAKAIGNSEWGIEAPLYLLRDSKGNLNGGLRVGYDSEKDDVFFGVFVGSNLGFLNPS